MSDEANKQQNQGSQGRDGALGSNLNIFTFVQFLFAAGQGSGQA
jgi:hypothetical protein